MFMLRSTHHLIVDTIKASAAKLIADQRSTIEGLRADAEMLHGTNEALGTENIKLLELLEERQVPAVRGSRGRFVKRQA